MNKLLLLLLLTACNVKEESGGPFVDAVSSASYGNPSLSFHKSSKQVRVDGVRNLRPPSDAITSATYTHVTTVANNRATYRNNEGEYIGFTLSGNTIAATAIAASEAAVDFAVTSKTYVK